MASPLSCVSKVTKIMILLLFLTITLNCVNSARILEVDLSIPTNGLDASDPTETGKSEVASSEQIPATTPSTQVTNIAPIAGPGGEASVIVPDVAEAPATAAAVEPDTGNVAPVATPVAPSPSGTTAPASSSASAGQANPQDASFSFFMHDILGGTNPSGRVVTGIAANSDVNNLPFSKPNTGVFPANGAVPLNSINVNSIINNNNYPFLVGLNGSPTNTILQNNGNNNVINGGNNNLPFVTAGQLPAGLTLQQLMFGSITVVDNELTEGHELGSAVLGKAQGFYLASSLDGSSHTLILTALFHNSDHHEVEDTISFFGVHRTATPVSHLAIVGGTGRYENVKGYATIETLHKEEDQHTTDGVETLTHFTLYFVA